MARVRQEPRPASRPTTVRRAAEWLVAAGIGALIALGADRSPAEVGTTPSAPAGDTTYMVRFMVQAPDARQVALVGSFNGWDTSATALEPAASGLWVGTVALPAGNHEYSFVVDGNRWIADPAAPIRVADEFGVNSSIIRLGSS